MMQNWASSSAPVSVRTNQRPRFSSNVRESHPRRGPHVAAQVEAVRDVFEVTQNLGLGGVLFGPLPLLLQLRGERERIEHALDVAARSGVAVAVPRAPDTGLGLQRHRPQAGLAQLVKGVEPGHARPHHHHVHLLASRCRLVFGHRWPVGSLPVRALNTAAADHWSIRHVAFLED